MLYASKLDYNQHVLPAPLWLFGFSTLSAMKVLLHLNITSCSPMPYSIHVGLSVYLEVCLFC